MIPLPAYAELHCLSSFTFLRGASHPEELVARAHQLEYSALAITDECSLAGVVRAHAAAEKCGLQLIIGAEIRTSDGLKLVLLATDRKGYGRLSTLITHGKINAPKGSYGLTRADLDRNLDGCLALLVPDETLNIEHARFVAERFPSCAWIAVEHMYGANDRIRLAELRELGESAGLPLADLARRAGLDQRDLGSLASSGALASLAGNRHNAHWLAAGARALPHLLRETSIDEALPRLSIPSEASDLMADYASLGLTLGRHPLALLRQRLKRMRLATAAELQHLPQGRFARTAGIVTCRQRPGTANGVVFVTLEDETGYTNVVVWNGLVERQRRELLGSGLLGVEGKIQREVTCPGIFGPIIIGERRPG